MPDMSHTHTKDKHAFRQIQDALGHLPNLTHIERVTNGACAKRREAKGNFLFRLSLFFFLINQVVSLAIWSSCQKSDVSVCLPVWFTAAAAAAVVDT